ncbi:Gfo/Idh/MocA family protein [Janthinobacterium sp. PC23-8]|uniref:Gfo/Idh/MocA family protein n=1 Tax=Janthinobacterium sp. PC23-8 TaxID=2012679 RepID=UPI000B967B52|nr:Gfo/Idh/MocA family oxidoreductase [Janthinobacterium sp. PC23-8]OYO31195.1 myo-inositol 2-dehydrogenase [Janthinobacterium sp. PC23-8]
MTLNEKVLLVGAGPMAIDYAKILAALNTDVVVIGRGQASASAFTEKTGIAAMTGGLSAYLGMAADVPASAIVAVGVEALAESTLQLLRHGVRRILLEKPGALTGLEIREIQTLAAEKNADVFIAYNRRLYASTLKAQEIIEADGGVQSMHFEFTEWNHVIRNLPKADGVKEAWLLGNSTHVIDLAFYLGGTPIEWQAFTGGGLDWHPAASIFSGAGRTDCGVLFSYQANWDAPGRWGVEVITANSRLIFRPMESLQIMRKGSVAIESVPIDNALDQEFKPGLHEQVRRFLVNDLASFCTLAEQVEKWEIYTKIAGYPPT